MSDDIVTRLRNSCVPDDSKWLESMPTDRLMLEAADEIERLRADRDRWREMAVNLYNACKYLDVDDRVEALAYVQNALIKERLDKAVPGES